MPSWGAPAGGDVNRDHPAKPPSQNSPAPQQTHGQSPGRYQRPSPYPNNARGRQNDNGQGQGLLQTPTQSQSGGSASFRSDNPFQSQSVFSPDNPFLNTSSNRSLFSPDNPFSQRDTSSPIHHPTPRPLFQSSPLVRTPGGRGQRFSPRTPNSSHFNCRTPPPGLFQSPSQRYQTPPQHRFQSGGNSRGHFSQGKRGFGNRNGSFSNPGGSDDIHKYVHTSMLEDPWRDLPPTPMLNTY